MPQSMCIAGGIMLDLVASLPSLAALNQNRDIWIPNSIDWHAAGTGSNLAIAASESGFSPVWLISKIGLQGVDGKPDLPGQQILDKLLAHDIHTAFCGDTSLPTGTNMIIYSQEGPRAIIADNRLELSFCERDLTTGMLEAVACSDVLFVSGYMLLDRQQAQVVLALLRQAKRSHRLTVLDVVPHEIYRHVSTDDFMQYTQDVDVLVSELNTVKRLYQGFGPVGVTDTEEIVNIATELMQSYIGVILRPSHDVQYTFDRQGLVDIERVSFPTTDTRRSRGFFDRLTMTSLLKVCSRYIQLPQETKANAEE